MSYTRQTYTRMLVYQVGPGGGGVQECRVVSGSPPRRAQYDTSDTARPGHADGGQAGPHALVLSHRPSLRHPALARH